MAGTDAAVAALVPVSDVLNGRIELRSTICRSRDAIERVRVELEVTGIATAFVGTTSPWPSYGRCTRPSWGAARRSELPAQHRRGGRLGDPHRAPSATRPVRRTARRAVSRWTGMEPRRSDPSIPARREEVTYESRRSRHVRTTRSPSARGGRHPVLKDDEVLVRVYATSVTRTDCGVRSGSVLLPSSPAFSDRSSGLPVWNSRARSPQSRRRHRVPRWRPRLRHAFRLECRVRLCP